MQTFALDSVVVRSRPSAGHPDNSAALKFRSSGLPVYRFSPRALFQRLSWADELSVCRNEDSDATRKGDLHLCASCINGKLSGAGCSRRLKEQSTGSQRHRERRPIVQLTAIIKR